MYACKTGIMHFCLMIAIFAIWHKDKFEGKNSHCFMVMSAFPQHFETGGDLVNFIKCIPFLTGII